MMAATPPSFTDRAFGQPNLGGATHRGFESGAVPKLAVITGGAGRLGRSVARELTLHGTDVALVGPDSRELDLVAESFAESARSLVLRCDMATETDVGVVVDFLQRLDRPVDYLIHSAGVRESSTIAWSSVKGLDEHYLWNVRAPYLLTQKLLPLLSARGGRVMFFLSQSAGSASTARDGWPSGDVHHRISTAGLLSFVSELRYETDKLGIQVMTATAPTAQWNAANNAVDDQAEDAQLKPYAEAVVRAILSDEVEVTELSLDLPSGTQRVDQR